MKFVYSNITNFMKKIPVSTLGRIFFVIFALQFYLVPLIVPFLREQYFNLNIAISYTVIVFFTMILCVQKNNLLLDSLTLWLVAISCLLSFFSIHEDGLPYKIYLGLLGSVFLIFIYINRKNHSMPSLSLIGVGIVWSLLTLILVSGLIYMFNGKQTSIPQGIFALILNTILFNLFFVTIIEELYFRGLFVTFAIANGYKEDSAYVIQAILFWLGHYFVITSYPLMFFVAIPILSISTTLIIKKYKTVSLSILVHTVVNVFSTLIVIIISNM